MTYLEDWHEASRQHPQWTTRAEADFINALCPSGATMFPAVPGTEHVTSELSDLFEGAFRTFQDIWRADLVRIAGMCGKAEMQILLAIERKTLGFGKLLEKLPRRLLTVGEVDPQTNHLRLKPNGAPILPATGIHRRNLDRGIRGLLSKDLITRVRSDPHPRYGVSSIYAPAPIHDALGVIVSRVVDRAAAGPDADDLLPAVNLVVTQINEALGGLLSEASEQPAS